MHTGFRDRSSVYAFDYRKFDETVIFGYTDLMRSIMGFFNEVAAIGAGFHGALAGAKIAVGGTSMLMASAGMATGVLPVVVGVAALAAGIGIGGAIGYVGTKQLLQWISGDPPEATPRPDRRRLVSSLSPR